MITVNSGPRKGKTFPDLAAYLKDEVRRQRRCKHSKTRFTYAVTGIATKQAHLVASHVCLVCKKRLDSVRVKIDKDEAARLYPGK